SDGTGPGGGGGGGAIHIDLTAFQNTVAVGGTLQLTAIAKDANNNAVVRTISFASSNNANATVTGQGEVTGVAVGVVTITASTSDPASATYVVNVVQPTVNTVLLEPADFDLAPGGTQQITVRLKDINGTLLANAGHTFVWTQDNATAATVDGNGLVTAHNTGAAVITARVDGKPGTATVHVNNVPVATVTVNGSSSMFVLFDQQLTATLKDGNGNTLSGRTVTWSTSDGNKATVDQSGNVHAAAIGDVTITATSETKVGSITIHITAAPVASVTIAPANPSILVNASVPLTATTKDANGNVLTGRVVTWGSNNAAAVTIGSSTGVAFGVAPGSALVTATSEGVPGTTTVTVANIPVNTVTITINPSTIIAGQQTSQITAVARDINNNILTGRAFTYTSGTTTVATVNGTGLLTGISGGTSAITATSEGKTSPPVTLTVLPSASTVVITCSKGSPTNMAIGEPGVACSAVVRDGGGNILTGRTIAWNSTNTGAATIDGSGNLTGVGVGATSISATVEGKTSNAITVNVALAPVFSVTVTPGSALLSEGQTQAIGVVLKDQWGNVLTGRVITIGNSNATAVGVSGGAGSYTASALAAGPACANAVSTLTFTSEGKSGTSVITVRARVNTVDVSPSSATVYINGNAQLIVTLKDVCGNTLDNTQRTITYATADGSKATVSGTGLVHGVQQTEPGPAVNLTVSSEGKNFVVPVTVRAPVATVLVSPLSSNIRVGEFVDLFITLNDAQGAGIDNGTRVINAVAAPGGKVTITPTGVAGVGSRYFRVTATTTGDVTITITSEGVSNATPVTIHIDP
ncbi:MAG: Ig-like domain-containing protein, partial [Gemmatimonadota bacterium]|nr:Ig-like domain-containing protein [Gemmatimonadota bacterium]